MMTPERARREEREGHCPFCLTCFSVKYGSVDCTGEVEGVAFHRRCRPHVKAKFSRRWPYPQVNLWANGVGRTYPLHVIIAGAFLGARPAGLYVNHKDGNKMNASPSNLEYVTHAENMRHAAANGLMASGDRHPKRKARVGMV